MNLITDFHPVPKPCKSVKVRKPMKKRRSTRARAKEFSPNVKSIAMERSKGRCELCDMRPIIDFHHAKYRSAGGTGELGNCIGLCKVCHDVIHHDGEASKYFRDMCETKAMELAKAFTEYT